MKTTILLVWALLCLVPATLTAQMKTEKHLSFKGKDELVLDIQIADSIRIHTWAKDEALVKASVSINDNKDNDAYLISYDESGSSLKVKAGFKKDYFKGKCNCCNEANISWDIWIPDNKYFTVETINANIIITGNTDRMTIKTISGYIDLAEPAGINADIDFSTISGTIYTNHSFFSAKGSTGVPARLHDRLNKGGSLIKLETISGDIFFRKE